MAYTKSKRSGKGERLSSYAKKRRLGLVPHQYSAEYRAWCEAVKRNDPTAIERTNDAWRSMIKRRFTYHAAA